MRLIPILVCLSVAGPVDSMAQAPKPADRWSETAYGISLDPPDDATLIEQPTDGTVALWTHPDGYTIGFDLTRGEAPRATGPRTDSLAADLERIIAFSEQSPSGGITAAMVAAQVQVKFARASTQTVLFKQLRIADRPGALAYYRVEDDDGTAWLLGQALIMLEPKTVAVLTLTDPRDLGERPADEFDTLPSRQSFERVVASVVVPGILELKDMIDARVEAGDVWLDTLGRESVRDALPDDQWYRLMEGDADVGYAHLTSRHDGAEFKREGLPALGTVVQIDMRHLIRGTAVDTQSRVYASAGGLDEVWSTKTTLRADAAPADRRAARLPNAQPRDREPTWVETGVRGGGRLMVTRESPPADETVRNVRQHERFVTDKPAPADEELAGSVEDLAWGDPPVAYLTQVELFALPRLIPADAEPMSFYAYNPATASLSLRTVRAVTSADGGKTVYDRPTARRAEIVTRFDAGGKLIEQQLPGGLRLVPTTPEELRRTWDLP